MRGIRGLATVVVLLLAACGGSDGTGDTVDRGSVATTFAATTTTAEPAGSASLDDMPQECIDALVGYLQVIEPVVEGVDFGSASVEDLESLGTELERVSEEYAASIQALDCPDPEGSDEEAFDAIIALAEEEAPGTVPYLEWARGFARSFGDVGESASGDCETDISRLEMLIDEKEIGRAHV